MIYRQNAEIQIISNNRDDRDFVQHLIMQGQLDKFVSIAVSIYRASGGFVGKDKNMDDVMKVLGVHEDILSEVKDYLKVINQTLTTARVDTIQRMEIPNTNEAPQNEFDGLDDDDLDLELDLLGDDEDECGEEEAPPNMADIIAKQRKMSGNG